jgi:hypothetical protein
MTPRAALSDRCARPHIEELAVARGRLDQAKACLEQVQTVLDQVKAVLDEAQAGLEQAGREVCRGLQRSQR